MTEIKPTSTDDSPPGVEAIRYAIAIVPGFVALKLALFMTDNALSDFEFGIEAALLSVIIYLLADGVTTLSFRSCARKRIRLRLWAWFILSATFTILTSIGVAVILEKDLILILSQELHFVSFSRATSQRPLLHVFDLIGQAAPSDRTKRPTGLDWRPETHVTSQPYFRVLTADGVTYEGRVQFAPTASEPMELYMSPVCEVYSLVGISYARKGPGPGVFIPERFISSIELVDIGNSACFKAWNPDYTFNETSQYTAVVPPPAAAPLQSTRPRPPEPAADGR